MLFRTSQAGLESLINRTNPTKWAVFLLNPLLFVAQILYSWFPVAAASPVKDELTVVCISDTHNHKLSVPDGDILIHAGDLTASGTVEEIQAALDWIDALPHRHKVVIAGNHDAALDHNAGPEADRNSFRWGGIRYLNLSGTTLSCPGGREVTVFGSPWTPRHRTSAFQYTRSSTDIWTSRPRPRSDILVTHGPPKGHLDERSYGCEFLLGEVWRSRPRLHVFGHVHGAYGKEWLAYDELQSTFERFAASGGLRNFLMFVWEFGKTWISGKRPRGETLLVNAASLGGLRNTIVRDAIVVRI